MRIRRITAVTAVALVVLGSAGPVGAAQASASGPDRRAIVPVTGASPFTSCTADSGQTGSTNYPGAEVEPFLAANPARQGNLLGEWQQDRWNDGGGRGLVAGVTYDGGKTWRTVPMPGLTKCTGGEYDRASDPWVTFGPRGTAYAISITFNAKNATNAVLVNRSTDGGGSWSPPVTLIRDTADANFNDKESITADPTDARFVYAVWDRSNDQAYTPAYFSRTTDGGKSWEPARAIYDPSAQQHGTIGHQIAVLPDGTLVDVFAEFFGTDDDDGDDRPFGDRSAEARRHAAREPEPEPTRVRALYSRDHGKTWSTPVTIATIDDSTVMDPDAPTDPQKSLRAPGFLPDVAVDARTGALYVVWGDGKPARSGSDVLLSASTDRGRHWTKPVRVDQAPLSPAGGNGQAFTPAVDVNADGMVGVSYYDFRSNTPAPGALADHWLVMCAGSKCPTRRSAWRKERHLGGPFDVELAARAPGYFLGDYMGLAHQGRSFFALFTMTHAVPGNQQDEYAVRATPRR